MDDPKKTNTNEWAIQHGENIASYNIVRPVRSSLKWTAYLARDNDGKRVTLTFIDKQRIMENYQIIAFQNGTPIETAKAEAARHVEEYEKDRIDAIQRIKGLGNARVAKTTGWSYDKERDQLVIISEYTPGYDLAYAAEKLNPKQLIYIFVQVLDGLKFIHQNGFLHLNLKPPRIYIDFEPDSPAVKITDFGFAIPMKGYTKECGGTALYMAPEVILNRSDQIDARADLYSFGVTMYCALTGRNPHEHRIDARGDKARMAEAVKSETGVNTPPSHYNREIPKELDRIILELLQKEPENRKYTDADDLSAEFTELWPAECKDMSRAGTTTLSTYD